MHIAESDSGRSSAAEQIRERVAALWPYVKRRRLINYAREYHDGHRVSTARVESNLDQLVDCRTEETAYVLDPPQRANVALARCAMANWANILSDRSENHRGCWRLRPSFFPVPILNAIDTGKFVCEILLSRSQIELIKQEEFPSIALFYLADQKRIQIARSWVGKERTFPPALLVDYDVEMVEVIRSDARLLAGFLRKDAVKFRGHYQFLPRQKPIKHGEAKHVGQEGAQEPSSDQGTGFHKGG